MKRNKNLKRTRIVLLICFAVVFYSCASLADPSNNGGAAPGSADDTGSGWVVVDTGQDKCYNNVRQVSCPGPGAAFHGQDAQYNGTPPGYTDNGDGTVTDNNTGLMWQKTPGSKMTWNDAALNAPSFNLAGYSDWRLPTIKELYSLMDFNGVTGFSADGSTPYIDTAYFDFSYGDTFAGERFIDAQYCSATEYGGTTMNGNATIFGVNFADGRIKGYPKYNKLYYVRYVRGRSGYGTNNFTDNGDGTITDLATGLMWLKYDSGYFKAGDDRDGKLDWQQALDWAEGLEYAGYSDWRLPNARELQGIVDYTRSPAATASPAIDPVFDTTSIVDGNGQVNYPFFWTGTTHLEGPAPGAAAVYVAFGEAQGYLRTAAGNYGLFDVHGAGAQRSDPKSGDPDDFPYGRGPQGDVICIYNFVRCVRQASTAQTGSTFALTVRSSPGGVPVTVSPADTNGSGNGTTPFTRSYTGGTKVTLTAPAVHNGQTFSRWDAEGTGGAGTTVQVTMDSDRAAAAYYTSQGSPVITVDKMRLDYGMIRGGEATPSQSLLIGNGGGGTLYWTAETDEAWVKLSPGSGTGDGVVTVSADGSGLAVGTHTGTITVSGANAPGTTQTVKVHLHVYNSGSAPFGSFDSPVNGSTVQGSISVSGWVLDDIAVDRVIIYLLKNGAPLYIGDALLVEGARPDVERTYPGYPLNYRAGWGYMLLTNFLPNQGSGTFTLYARAVDKEGSQVALGTKIITCDNANAVKPFGAIDTPAQGGVAAGSAYVNAGWVLTPRPNTIPTDGSTITVWVDGVPLGSPVYNRYRADIAALFPGYNNSGGAGGYFYLDTTAYSSGTHTIAWSVTDSAGNKEGIGSRYFSIVNTGGTNQANAQAAPTPDHRGEFIKDPPDEIQTTALRIKELQHVEFQVSNRFSAVRGYLSVDGKLKPLPTGSTLDHRTGRFYWDPGAGFVGCSYRLVFIIETPDGDVYNKTIEIAIEPE